MITYESEAKSLGPESERMRTVLPPPVSISYLFTPNHPSLSNFLFISLFFSFSPLFLLRFLSLLLILLSHHHPIPHYQSWPNADLNPLTSRLHYPLQPFLHIHQRKRGSSLFLKPPKLSPPNPPNIDPQNLCLIYLLIVYDFIFNQMWMFLNLRGQFYGGNKALEGGGKLFVPPFLLPSPHPSIQIENGVSQFPGGCGRAVGLSPVLCCF